MVSQEVRQAVDEIRRERDVIVSMRKADELRNMQAADLKAQIEALQTGDRLSPEDKAALLDAITESQATNQQLPGAVLANTDGPPSGLGAASVPAASNVVPPVGEDGHPTEAPTSGDVLAANGPANHPAGGSAVPMMPNMAFDPDPTGARGSQPGQPAAIATAGGFVVSGGGTTQRAVGSMPDSPSSSQVVPLDPDAKAPASNADVIKSGLGDSSQNALLGADGKPVADGPGVAQEPSQAARDAAQKQADLVAKETAAREANPLNLAPEGTPQAGSVNRGDNPIDPTLPQPAPMFSQSGAGTGPTDLNQPQPGGIDAPPAPPAERAKSDA